LISGIYAQELPSLKLKNDFGFKSQSHKTFFSKDVKMSKLQPKRKTVTSYYGAGYTFVIFTSAPMNEAYPVFDTRKGDFLSEINVYFGFAVAKALTIEIEHLYYLQIQTELLVITEIRLRLLMDTVMIM
jgi:hypothetical protein